MSMLSSLTFRLFLTFVCCILLSLLFVPAAGSPGSPRQSDSKEPSSLHRSHLSTPPTSSFGRIPITSHPYTAEKLIFSDDFTEFDLSVWEHELTMGGGGNWEFEYYTNNRTNSFVKNSTLFLKPTLTADFIGEANVHNGYTMDMWGSGPGDLCTGNAFYGCERTSGAGGNIINPIQSAKVRTSNSLNIKYGRVEVSAKLPVGDWLWPAIWMMPRYNSYGMWPASGEIDIMEAHGNNVSYVPGGHNTVSSTLHWGPTFGQDPFPLTHSNVTLPKGQSFSDAFHTFGLFWNATTLYTYIDSDANRLLQVDYSTEGFWQRGGWGTSFADPWEGRGTAAPFDQEFYLVMNVAVGGVTGFFPDGVGGKPWGNTAGDAANEFYAAKSQWLPTWNYGTNGAALQVDWVRVFQ